MMNTTLLNFNVHREEGSVLCFSGVYGALTPCMAAAALHVTLLVCHCHTATDMLPILHTEMSRCNRLRLIIARIELRHAPQCVIIMLYCPVFRMTQHCLCLST